MNTAILNKVIQKSVIIHFYPYHSISTICVLFTKAHTWPRSINLNATFATSGFMGTFSKYFLIYKINFYDKVKKDV